MASPRSIIHAWFNDFVDQSDEEDEEEDDILDDMYYYEEEHNNNEIMNDMRYLGISVYDQQYNVNLLASTISPASFFRYSYSDVMKYLENFSIVKTNNQMKPPDIMLIRIDADDAYTVINKTYWLRLVQRRWRNVLKERNHILRNTNFIQNREIYGSITSSKLPGLQGMLYGF